MKHCKECGREFTEREVEGMLIWLFGSLEHIDEDTLVENDGLCPDCWIGFS